jgi:hypothetical protein
MAMEFEHPADTPATCIARGVQIRIEAVVCEALRLERSAVR